MKSRWWRRAQWTGGVLILVILVAQLGSGPFLAGLGALGPGPVVAALALTALATAAAARRWQTVAGRLGVRLGWREATAAYYGSQFLNATLPGGVLGDVHRALRHGRETGDRGAAARAVFWERTLGLGGFVLLAVPVLAFTGHSTWSLTFAAVLLAALVVARLLPAVLTRDLRTIADRTALTVLVTSLVVAAAHGCVFLVAATAVGVDAPARALLPAAVLALLGSVVPLGVAGWGPREGAAAWAFAAVGLGAAPGVAVSVGYGVLALCGCLPGAVVLAIRTRTGTRTTPEVASA